MERAFEEHVGREKKISRDDWAHGSLLIVNELLRCSNVEGEVSSITQHILNHHCVFSILVIPLAL